MRAASGLRPTPGGAESQVEPRLLRPFTAFIWALWRRSRWPVTIGGPPALTAANVARGWGCLQDCEHWGASARSSWKSAPVVTGMLPWPHLAPPSSTRSVALLGPSGDRGFQAIPFRHRRLRRYRSKAISDSSTGLAARPRTCRGPGSDRLMQRARRKLNSSPAGAEGLEACLA